MGSGLLLLRAGLHMRWIIKRLIGFWEYMGTDDFWDWTR